LNTDFCQMTDLKVQPVLGSAELDMQGKKIWVAITAHNPLNRIDCLLRVVRAYSDFPCAVSVCVYINYEAQDDQEPLEEVLRTVDGVQTEVKVASPGYEGWYLTWAHKTDLALAVLNRQADYYIYQENDMVLSLSNFIYWIRWHPRLKRLGLEPGFVRYENFEGRKIPFDNHYPYSLLRETPSIWGSVGFTVPKILVVDRSINFFAQLANPYYGAMILDQEDAGTYIRSDSYDPEKSYARVGIRNWPIADRSSMGLAFENAPSTYEHRRCVPVYKDGNVYKLHPDGLILHDDTKYSEQLSELHETLLDCDCLLKLS
jgi:hypothetical protein